MVFLSLSLSKYLIALYSPFFWGYPDSSVGKESTCQCRRHGFDPWSRKIPWRREGQLILIFLPEKSHGQRSLVGYTVHGVAKSQTQLSD